MLRVLVDANVFLDLLLDEGDSAEYAYQLCQLIESEKIEGYVTPITLSKIFDVSKEKQGVKVAWQAISDIRAITKICPVDDNILNKASWFNLENFEAAVQLACAVFLKLDVIITQKVTEFTWFFMRDFQDIAENILSVLPPDEFLILFSTIEFINSKNQLEYSPSSSVDRNESLDIVAPIISFIRDRIGDSNKRLDVVNRIVKNAPTIVGKSIKTLSVQQPQLVEPRGSLCNKYLMAACLRDMEIILRDITYAILVGNSSIINEHCLNLREIYEALGVPISSFIFAIQKMKEITIEFANDPIGVIPGDCSNLISELATYFDVYIAAVA